MTRAASLLLRVVGLALVLVAAAGFLLVGDGGAWTARASVPAGRTAVLVEPAVASVLGPLVSIRVEPDGGDEAAYFIGRGRSDDLAAYVQGRDVVRIVGFDGSRRLALQPGPPAPAASAPASVPSATSSPTLSATPSATPSPTPSAPTSSPAGSPARWQPPMTVDLWQQQVTGPQARELSWRPGPGARSILVAHEDGSALPALEVRVTWKDGRWLWYPVAVLVLGLAMIVGGLVLIGTVSFGGLGGRAARARTALASRGRARRPSAPKSTTTPPAARTTPDEVRAESAPGADVPAQGVLTHDEPDTAPTGAEGEKQNQPVADVLPTRANRGRRRKETAWQRARARARSRVGGSR